MSFDAVVVALALISASAIAIGLLMRKHSAYRESVADALARGDIAKEEVEALKRQLEEMNQNLVASSGREEGLKATLALKGNGTRRKNRFTRRCEEDASTRV